MAWSYLCLTHAALDLITGAAMLFGLDKATEVAHGKDAKEELIGTSAEDKIALRTSESLVGLLLVDVALLLAVSSTSSDETFRRRFCMAALGTHGLMASWRLTKQRQVAAVRSAIPAQLAGDAILASSWMWYLLRKK